MNFSTTTMKRLLSCSRSTVEDIHHRGAHLAESAGNRRHELLPGSSTGLGFGCHPRHRDALLIVGSPS
jgi:hypothetical protein